jgi:hypothetical protein
LSFTFQFSAICTQSFPSHPPSAIKAVY